MQCNIEAHALAAWLTFLHMRCNSALRLAATETANRFRLPYGHNSHAIASEANFFSSVEYLVFQSYAMADSL